MIYVAVCLVSESSDYYQYLLEVYGFDDLISQLKERCEEFPYVSSVYLDMQDTQHTILSWEKGIMIQVGLCWSTDINEGDVNES